MMHITTTLKSAHLLKATTKVKDDNEEPPVEKTVKTAHNAKSNYASNTWTIKIKTPDKLEDMKEKKIAPLDALFPKVRVPSNLM